MYLADARAGTTFGAKPPLVTMPCIRSVGRICWRSSPRAVWATVSASAAFTPSSGKAEAWDAFPVLCMSNMEAAMIFARSMSKRRRMHHHSGVNAIKSATLELQNLATGVAHFLGRSADNGFGETDLVCHLGGSNRCADGRGGNDIVAAGVANIG